MCQVGFFDHRRVGFVFDDHVSFFLSISLRLAGFSSKVTVLLSGSTCYLSYHYYGFLICVSSLLNFMLSIKDVALVSKFWPLHSMIVACGSFHFCVFFPVFRRSCSRKCWNWEVNRKRRRAACCRRSRLLWRIDGQSQAFFCPALFDASSNTSSWLQPVIFCLDLILIRRGRFFRTIQQVSNCQQALVRDFLVPCQLQGGEQPQTRQISPVPNAKITHCTIERWLRNITSEPRNEPSCVTDDPLRQYAVSVGLYCVWSWSAASIVRTCPCNCF